MFDLVQFEMAFWIESNWTMIIPTNLLFTTVPSIVQMCYRKAPAVTANSLKRLSPRAVELTQPRRSTDLGDRNPEMLKNGYPTQTKTEIRPLS